MPERGVGVVLLNERSGVKQQFHRHILPNPDAGDYAVGGDALDALDDLSVIRHASEVMPVSGVARLDYYVELGLRPSLSP